MAVKKYTTRHLVSNVEYQIAMYEQTGQPDKADALRAWFIHDISEFGITQHAARIRAAIRDEFARIDRQEAREYLRLGL
jgi:uncharacterized protein YgfB (UPF0149 family)